jgi:hypothetical protein
LKEAAQVSRTVQQYLAELEQANPVAEQALVSTTDPDALLATKGGETAHLAILHVASTTCEGRQSRWFGTAYRQARDHQSAFRLCARRIAPTADRPQEGVDDGGRFGRPNF